MHRALPVVMAGGRAVGRASNAQQRPAGRSLPSHLPLLR